MRRFYPFIIATALLLIAARSLPGRLVRLTLVNKSGMDIEVSLAGTIDDDNSYYLRVAEGDQTSPTEKTFTIAADIYKMNAYFVELWDPVYGASCEDRQSSVDVTHNTRVIVYECASTPPNAGETPQVKLGGPTHRTRR